MATTIDKATRCDRCGRVGYDRRVMSVGVLCRRCVGELGDLLRAFMRGER